MDSQVHRFQKIWFLCVRVFVVVLCVCVFVVVCVCVCVRARCLVSLFVSGVDIVSFILEFWISGLVGSIFRYFPAELRNQGGSLGHLCVIGVRRCFFV